MSKEHKPTITAAWITGGLGCLGVVCTALVGLYIGYLQLSKSDSTSITLALTVPVPPAITEVVPTVPETTLEVRNLTNQEICYVYIVPAGSETWGDDWLGEDITIPPNEGRTFYLDTGMYYARAENCNHEVIGQLDNAHIQGDKWWDVK